MSNSKKKYLFFSKLGISQKKSQIKLKNELKIEAEGQQQLLKQDFGRYFQNLSNIELQQWKMTRNLFCLNSNILFSEGIFGYEK